MMYDNYKDNYGAEVVMRVTCQKCGTQIYMKQIGYSCTDNRLNNSHSLSDQFEPMPKGWEIKNHIGWCCPHCVNEYNFMKEFKPIYK